ncbi:lytic polysaccharide monooxygenase [Actinoplanes regularis]|uniref:Chitin-binding protein n=1 Tax=Actinoplanes regularis TaxID=52697 RepID=A0A238Y233_9ACTN|nr:lytic polysaccharide monooxygenase [Actinoplanes regularis]GIE86278.1 cellulose-binding protein [Actinoplanes regularis]GLW27975.1 cellulose-binding protein [Actinoplanes regularis]SNR64868.1 chitin-binding protein [Actinoplanes regularis]
MRRRFTLPLLTVAAVVGSLFVAVSPASAHGYISSPPSRQANCASGAVANCGDIIYEPQSVEAPKGSTQCNGGGSRFAVLNDNSKNWPAATVGQSVTFNWVLTARHSTATWEYFIGGTLLASFNDGGAQPGATKSHTVNMKGFTGRQTVLARWNIADTVNAFYSCVDLNIGGGGGTTPPTTPPTTSPTTPPTTSPTTPPTSGTTTWAAGTTYKVGDRVTYAGKSYQCRQAHTAINGWEPPNVPALWTAL